MVEVVALEEFTELRKSVEGRLDSIEGKLNDLIKDVDEKHAQSKADVEDLRRRVDDLAESSKGFIQRLREAILPRVAEPSRIESNQVGNTGRTLGKVAELIMGCPNFFDWDRCQENCPMYRFCDDIAAVQDVSKLSKEDLMERAKGIFRKLLIPSEQMA